jgi:hypothetical protein
MPASTTTICHTASYCTNSGVTSRHHWPAASAFGSRHSASRTCGNGYWSTVSTAVTARTDTVAIGHRQDRHGGDRPPPRHALAHLLEPHRRVIRSGCLHGVSSSCFLVRRPLVIDTPSIGSQRPRGFNASAHLRLPRAAILRFRPPAATGRRSAGTGLAPGVARDCSRRERRLEAGIHDVPASTAHAQGRSLRCMHQRAGDMTMSSHQPPDRGAVAATDRPGHARARPWRWP